jgi:hypothetical protein
LPGADSGYRRVLLLGTTGAGKTTVIRQFLGTDPLKDRFPSPLPYVASGPANRLLEELLSTFEELHEEGIVLLEAQTSRRPG